MTRHFLNSICTHIADIDYETIITYTGSYDEMVLAKTQVPVADRIAECTAGKKISQLNEFIARFSAGTRSSQVQSRRKEVERLQVTELARSNIQRPYIKFEQKRPSGKHILEIEHLGKTYGDQNGHTRLHGEHYARGKNRADGAQWSGEDDSGECAAGEFADHAGSRAAQDQRL